MLSLYRNMNCIESIIQNVLFVLRFHLVLKYSNGLHFLKSFTSSLIYQQALVQDLQIAKRSTWEEREKQSSKYQNERKTNLANKVGLELCEQSFVLYKPSSVFQLSLATWKLSDR